MRHHRANRKFGRVKKVRTALMKSLAYALIKEGKIVTTEAKAKELRPMIERLITNAKSGTLSSRRLLAPKLGIEASGKLVKDIAPKYKDRKGGYTRVTKVGPRIKDAAPMAQIEFV